MKIRQTSFMNHTEFSFNKETQKKRKGAQATNVFSLRVS